MAKLLVLSGLPGSGKTEEARRILEKSGNYVRVNKDSLRSMLHFDKWNGKNEGLTIDVEKAIVKAMLSKNECVVVDDTNLNEKIIQSCKSIADSVEATFEHKYVTTSLQDCLDRNELRKKNGGHYVPRSVIINMARRIGQKDAFGRKELIVDLDGTLADTGYKLHFVRQEPKDWKSFFELIPKDPVRKDIKSLVKYLVKRYDLTPIIVSARMEYNRKPTEDWLKKNKIPFYTVLLRKDNDFRDDYIVKEEMLQKFLDQSRIFSVIDDRPRVIRMWKRNRIPVIDAGLGIEF